MKLLKKKQYDINNILSTESEYYGSVTDELLTIKPLMYFKKQKFYPAVEIQIGNDYKNKYLLYDDTKETYDSKIAEKECWELKNDIVSLFDTFIKGLLLSALKNLTESDE